eukprot:5810085-Alexandrium_andersonii.AAC.1
MLRRIPHEMKDLARANIASMIASTRGTVRFASMCSGTDLIVPIFQQLFARLLQDLDLEAGIRHVFSVESDPQKQQWAIDNFAPPRVFDNICGLTGRDAFDVVSGGRARIPHCHIVYV